MYQNEIKKELQAIYNSNKNIDSELVNIKIAIHNLENKFKVKNKEIIKNWRA